MKLMRQHLLALFLFVGAGACSSETAVNGSTTCPTGQLLCNGVCVANDAYNCGACGVTCTAGQVCNGATCGCPLQQTLCGATCVDTTSNPANCGQCGLACAPGQACVGGICSCQAGLVNCGAGCTNPLTDAANCGQCGVVCAAPTPYCSVGVCSGDCGAGLTACGTSCVDLSTDLANCGQCGVACPAGQGCSNGVCGCPAGQADCGAGCVDVLSNPVNCGTCGVTCPSGVCTAGACAGTGTGGTGGTGTGGTSTGGTSTGGTGTGGTSTGGTSTGGTSTGGTGTGGTSTGGNGGVNVNDPPGYVRYNDWYGCSWTGIDTTGVGTTIAPQDFLSRASGEPFCVSGTVGAHPQYESVALLGFNIHEDFATADCTYNPAAASSAGPPGVVPTGSGVAVNFVKTSGDATLRVQIQGPNGATDPNDRWCYTIAEVQGPIFAEYTDFYTECWGEEGNRGSQWSGQPISAVVFLVPGSTQPTPYEFCIDGFADGNSVADAPPSGMEAPLLSGTIGGTDAAGTTDPDYKRVKIIGDDGKSYIVQNNNWGVAEQSEQLLSYVGNSFKVLTSTGWTTGQGVPASFPSVYIGANGNVNDGLLTTDANLPKQVSTIGSIPTTLQWSGKSSGNFNVSYDVWFAASAPAAGSYDDAISGFVMVWLYDPPDSQPIGSADPARRVTIAGHTWDVWVGPRGGSGTNSNAPVVSYTSSTLVPSLTFDLKDFIDDAAQYGIQPSWYLTDVFGGFEIWTGSDAVGLSLDKFTCHVE